MDANHSKSHAYRIGLAGWAGKKSFALLFLRRRERRGKKKKKGVGRKFWCIDK